MPAAAIGTERPPATPAGAGEVYALSMETLRRLGKLAHMGASHETDIAAGLAYADFVTGAAENLKTDKELSHLLDVARTYEFEIRGGQAVAADGTPMVDIVRRGYEQSKAEASKDARKRVQAVRDQGDLITADRVDRLRPGEAYAAISMCPEEAIAAGIDMESLGYVRGMSFVQVFVNVGGKIIVHCLSVEASNKQAWRDVMQQYGADIPIATPADEWIRAGVQRAMPISQALGLAARIRESYYKRVGQTHRRYSVTDFMRAHDPIVQTYFDRYIRPLATAIHTNQNNDAMQGLAEALLRSGVTKLEAFNDDEMKTELGRIARSDESFTFTAASGRTMERLVRYALVENLRARLLAELTHGGSSQAQPAAAAYEQVDASLYNAAAMHAQLAQHIQTGVQAKRTYGGCSGLRFANGSDASGNEVERSDPQEPYGGRAKDNERQEKSGEACDYCIDSCYCSGYNDDGTRSGSKVRVRVRRDADGKAHCLRAGCGACLGPNGEVIDIGGIARRAKQLEREHARQQRVGKTAASGALAAA